MRPFVLLVSNFVLIVDLSWSTKTAPFEPALCASSDALPCCFDFSGSVEVREQRDEHQAVQLFSPPVLAPEFHGCLHLVAAICWGERYAVRSSELLERYPGGMAGEGGGEETCVLCHQEHAGKNGVF